MTFKALCGVLVTVEPLGSDELRAKQSELRVYRDLLIQQVTGVKTALTGPSPDVTVSMCSACVSLICRSNLFVIHQNRS